MYRVLIVDDELVIRRGLKKVIHWENHEFQICGEASNGREGLEKANALKPDLLIVDIKMPGINGLEMVRKLRTSGSKYRIILLTGYSEFKFAQEAIALGIDAYILKPIDEDELIKELGVLRNKLDEDKKDCAISETVRLAADRVLQSILFEQLDNDQIHGYNQLYSLSFPWISHQVVLADFDKRIWNDQRILNSVRLCMEEYVNQNKLGLVFECRDSICILIKDRANNQIVINHLFALHKKVLLKSGVVITFSMGQIVTMLKDVLLSYQSAVKQLEKKFLYNTDYIISHESVQLQHRHRVTIRQDFNNVVQKLYMALDMAHSEAIDNILDDFKFEFLSIEAEEHDVKASYITLYTSLLHAMTKNYEDVIKVVSNNGNIPVEIYKQQDLHSLHTYFQLFIHMVAKEIGNCRSNHVMKSIQSYIDRNYDKNIKLSSLSEVYNYNSVYLGRRLKEYMGMSFNEYLNKVRIENAKKLLKQGSKVHDVAHLVGYLDKDYFYIKFKELEGVSPSHYKYL